MSEQIMPIRHTKEYQMGYAEGFSEGKYETLKNFENMIHVATNPAPIMIKSDEATKLFEDMLKERQILIDKYIEENKKLKEALKICLDDISSEGYTGYEEFRQLLKEE